MAEKEKQPSFALTPFEAQLLIDASFGEAFERAGGLESLLERLGNWLDQVEAADA